MSNERVESVSSLVSAMAKKRGDAENERTRLKEEMDRLMDEANALQTQARTKRRDAKSLYKQIGSLDYGDWVSDILRPLADELARRTEKKANLLGPVGLGAKVIIILTDDESDPDFYRKERLELVLEPDFSGDDLVLRYETGAVSDRYAPGTVGQVNGLNNITAPLPDSVEEILGLFRLYPAIINKNRGGKKGEQGSSESYY